MHTRYPSDNPGVEYCQYGRVVVRYDPMTKHEIFGHIIGFSRNSNRKLMIRVKWEGNWEQTVCTDEVEFIGKDVQ